MAKSKRSACSALNQIKHGPKSLFWLDLSQDFRRKDWQYRENVVSLQPELNLSLRYD